VGFLGFCWLAGYGNASKNCFASRIHRKIVSFWASAPAKREGGRVWQSGQFQKFPYRMFELAIRIESDVDRGNRGTEGWTFTAKSG
jgi:hypothetical protein